MTYPKNWDGDCATLARYTAETDRMDRAERRFERRQDRARRRAEGSLSAATLWLRVGLVTAFAALVGGAAWLFHFGYLSNQ